MGLVLTAAGSAAGASNGGPVILGGYNDATTSTWVTTTTGDAIRGITSYEGTSAGLYGENDGVGPAVHGESYGTPQEANGVEGIVVASAPSGVYGVNLGGGPGVTGRSGDNGVGVYADDSFPTGVALRTTGTLQFQNRSGLVTISSGQKSIATKLAGVNSTSLVLATVQQSGGYFVKAAVAAGGSFTIYINKAPPSPITVQVAYLILN